MLRIDVHVAKPDVRRAVDAHRRRERRIAAGDAVRVVVRDRDVLRRVDLEGHRLRARRRFLLGLRGVEAPVLHPIELDLGDEMMLGR